MTIEADLRLECVRLAAANSHVSNDPVLQVASMIYDFVTTGTYKKIENAAPEKTLIES